MDNKHLLQEYEWPADEEEYVAEVRYRTEDSPEGADFVCRAIGFGDTDAAAAQLALRMARQDASGRMTLLSLHIGRNRVKMLASPLLLEEVLAQEKEAADGAD